MEKKNSVRVTGASEEIFIDFGEICRFCLAETNSKIFIYDKCLIDNSTELQESIYNFITKLSSIKMEGTENFPSLVCENCYELIKVCYNFSQLCQRSDKSLRDCYEKTLSETKSKLNYADREESITDNNEVQFIFDNLSKNLLLKSNNLPFNSEVTQDMRNEEKRLKSISITKSVNSLNVLKAKKLKYKLSFSQTQTQSKLAEDLCRSNDEMLGLPKSDELQGQKSSYHCLRCPLKFLSSEALKFHYIETHELVKKFKSVIMFQNCTKSFGDQEKLINHYEKIHNKLTLSKEDLNHKVKKSIKVGKRHFYCHHCVPYKIFQTEDHLVQHLKESHEMNENTLNASFKSNTGFSSKLNESYHRQNILERKKNEVTLGEINCTPKLTDADADTDRHLSNLKLFKVFLCTDCSPPVSFMGVNACLQHKMETHDKEMENIPLKELSAMYVDSLDVFKQCQEKNFELSFKVFCNNCSPPRAFTSTDKFVDHMYSGHEGSTLENWNIESKSQLDGKDKSKKGTEMWKCLDCASSYFRRQSLYYHMREKHNKHITFEAIKCPETDCTKSFFTNRQLIQHGISVHQKYFAHFHNVFNKKILNSTTREDNLIKNFECDICQKKYVCKNSLKRHILKTHLGKVEMESVMCPYCGKTLSNKLNLKSHVEFVHEALFVNCPLCNKKINFRTIGKHYKTHQTNPELAHSNNLFLCNLCGKVLKSKRGFEDHQKLHNNIRDQLCDVCGSGFTTKKFLHLHKKIHEGVQRKVFECPQCDKVFSGRHTLNRHLLTHSGKKNFICEICSKCFYTLQELNRHVRCHKKEYKFDCQLCEMKFLDKSRFRHHMMRHRNIRPHKCQFCDKMFIVRGKMNLHMAAKHNVDIQSTKAVWKDPKTYVPLDDLL